MILAYLEDLARNRTELILEVEGQELAPFGVFVDLVREDKNSFILSLRRVLPPDLKPKAKLHLLFHLDGTRLQAEVAYQGRAGYMQAEFTLPEAVYFAERRNKLRARFGNREKAKVTILQGLFDGIGVSGKLLDLSMEGLCLEVERALEIQGNRRLKLHAGLFHPGQPLMLIRVQDLPHTPQLEFAGAVAHLASDGTRLRMGVRLTGVAALETRCLEQVLTRRLPGFTKSFPVRHRRLPGSSEDAGPEPEPEELEPEPEESVPPVPEAEALPADPALAVPRTSKHLLLILADSLERAILAQTLQADGYQHILEANSLVQALDRCKKHLPDLLLVDGRVGPHLAPEIILKLRGLDFLGAVPAVVLMEPGDVKVQLGAKGLGIRDLVTKPVDYEGRLKGTLGGLLDAPV